MGRQCIVAVEETPQDTVRCDTDSLSRLLIPGGRASDEHSRYSTSEAFTTPTHAWGKAVYFQDLNHSRKKVKINIKREAPGQTSLSTQRTRRLWNDSNFRSSGPSGLR